MLRYQNKVIDSWDVFDMSPRKWWVQAMFCEMTLCFFGWTLIICSTFLLIYLFD